MLNGGLGLEKIGFSDGYIGAIAESFWDRISPSGQRAQRGKNLPCGHSIAKD